MELIPAYKENEYLIHYIIPRNNGLQWITTIPNEINDQVNKMNLEHNELMIPLIRILKYWNKINGSIYTSYSLEKAIIDMPFPNYEKLSDYFYFGVEHLSLDGLDEDMSSKVEEFKKAILSIKDDTQDEEALYRLSKIIPFI